MLKKAVVYIRVSTGEQAKAGRYSLGTQSNMCQEYANANNIAIEKLFEDPGRSATNLNRPGLQEMLSYLESNASISSVIVLNTDRLARNAFDHLQIKNQLFKLEVELISVTQPNLDDTPTGKAMDLVIAAMNQLSSDQSAIRVQSNMKRKANEGWYPGCAPIGYINVKNPMGKNIIEIDKKRAKYIKRAFDLFKTGNYSVRELGDILYDEGFRGRSNRRVSKNAMHHLLARRFYLGEFKWKSEIYQGNHEPILDQATFDTVQKILCQNGTKGNRRHKHSFLLRGFLYCTCTRRMTAEHHKKKKKSYYRCTSGKECKEPYIEVGDMESAITKLFRNIKFSKEMEDTIIEKVQNLFEERKKLLNKEKQQYINQKTAVEKQRDTAERKLLDDVISDDDFKRLRENFVKELDSLNKQINRLEAERNFNIDDVSTVLHFVRDIHLSYSKAPEKLKKRYLNLIWDKIIIHDKKVLEAKPTPLFNSLIQAGVLITKELDSIPVLKSSLWLGRRDSNPRMHGPKPCALPLGDSPSQSSSLFYRR